MKYDTCVSSANASSIPLSNGVHTCAHTYAQRKKHAAAHLYTLQLTTSMTNKHIILVIDFLITLYHIVFMLYIILTHNLSRHDIAEILLKMALNTNQSIQTIDKNQIQLIVSLRYEVTKQSVSDEDQSVNMSIPVKYILPETHVINKCYHNNEW